MTIKEPNGFFDKHRRKNRVPYKDLSRFDSTFGRRSKLKTRIVEGRVREEVTGEEEGSFVRKE